MDVSLKSMWLGVWGVFRNATRREVAINYWKSLAVDLEHKVSSKEIQLANANEKISLLERRVSELEAQATTDALTGLTNRRGFENAFGRIFRQLTRQTVNNGLGYIFIDIDDFKAFNTKLGHDTADLVLVDFAKVMKQVFPRMTDVCARWGGEEFVVLMPDTPKSVVAEKAEQLRKTIAEHGKFAGKHHITISVGVSHAGCGAKGDELVRKQANEAMNVAKVNGKNQVVVAD